MNDTVRNAVARFSSLELQIARRAIERELLAACAAGVQGTRSHEGQLEMLGAIGAELDARGALLPAPPFVDVCHEDGMRGPTVRVF